MIKRAIVAAVLLVGMWVSPRAMAGITITTDSALQLSGSFTALSTTDAEAVSSAVFGNRAELGGAELLPGSALLTNLLRLWRSDAQIGSVLIFQTAGIGTPDDPSFTSTFSSTPRAFADVSGSYSNNASSTSVYFLFSSLADSGGAGGTFSGNFDFSTSPIMAIPEPEIYAMMMAGLGLVGFMARRKRKLQSSAAS